MVEPFPGPPVPSLQPPGVGSHLLHVASKMQHVGESFLLPRFLLSLLPCLLFLFASSFFLPGSEVGQERTDGDLTDWLPCNTARAPMRSTAGLVLPKTSPSPPSPEGDSQPCGPGAPSPSRCESAAALPSPLAAVPAEGEDVGLDTLGNLHPLCLWGHIPDPKSPESPKSRSAAPMSPKGACGPVTMAEGASPLGTAASQQPDQGLPRHWGTKSSSNLRLCLAGTWDVSGLALRIAGKGSWLCAHSGEGGNSDRGGRLQTYNPVLEGHELLFLLLPALKVGFDEGLQLIQVFLHAFAVDVLHQIETAVMATLPQVKPSRSCRAAGHSVEERCEGITSRGWTLSALLTSKSSLSPSGILGGTRFGMKTLQSKVSRRMVSLQQIPGTGQDGVFHPCTDLSSPPL